MKKLILMASLILLSACTPTYIPMYKIEKANTFCKGLGLEGLHAIRTTDAKANEYVDSYIEFKCKDLANVFKYEQVIGED